MPEQLESTQEVEEVKIQRPKRAKLTAEESLKRMEAFPERSNQFVGKRTTKSQNSGKEKGLTITLTPEQEAFVTGKIANGDFTQLSDLIHCALHLLSEQERLEDELPLEELRSKIAAADEQFSRDEYRTFDDHSLTTLFEDIQARGEKRLQELQKRASA